MRRGWLRAGMILALTLPGSAGAGVEAKRDVTALFTQANSLYKEQKPEEAAKLYEEILASGFRSGNLYYNLGNAYFKLGKKGLAILNYERAGHLMPRDADLQSNLAYARSLVKEEGDYRRPWCRVQVDRGIEAVTVDETVLFASALYAILLLLLALRTLNRRMRTSAGYGAWIAGAVLLLNVAVLGLKIHDETIVRTAVVTKEVVEARFAPEPDATVYFRLHEGALVRILNEETGWAQVRRPDGRIGWVRTQHTQRI